jgi:hypothetical protein
LSATRLLRRQIEDRRVLLYAAAGQLQCRVGSVGPEHSIRAQVLYVDGGFSAGLAWPIDFASQ